jgi:hypothetical protein
VSDAAVPDAAVLAVAVAVAYLPGLVLLAVVSVPPGLLDDGAGALRRR